jgi:hypothetical protein
VSGALLGGLLAGLLSGPLHGLGVLLSAVLGAAHTGDVAGGQLRVLGSAGSGAAGLLGHLASGRTGGTSGTDLAGLLGGTLHGLGVLLGALLGAADAGDVGLILIGHSESPPCRASCTTSGRS